MKLGRALAWGATLLVLGLVFSAYLAPQFVMTLADRLWSCF